MNVDHEDVGAGVVVGVLKKGLDVKGDLAVASVEGVMLANGFGDTPTGAEDGWDNPKGFVATNGATVCPLVDVVTESDEPGNNVSSRSGDSPCWLTKSSSSSSSMGVPKLVGNNEPSIIPRVAACSIFNPRMMAASVLPPRFTSTYLSEKEWREDGAKSSNKAY